MSEVQLRCTRSAPPDRLPAPIPYAGPSATASSLLQPFGSDAPRKLCDLRRLGRGREDLLAHPRATAEQRNGAEPPTRRHERLQWAELLRRTYAIEVLVCDLCGARREWIAFCTATNSIRRILEHLGLPKRPPPFQHTPAALFELD